MPETKIPATSAAGALRSGTSRLPPTLEEASGVPDQRITPALNQKRVSAAAVRELCGGISDMTLWRWLHDPDMGFPKARYIARRRYWRYSEIIDWLEARATTRTG
jgi:predicted DNA-binding transcriptional regulator AlpA